jgi:hypothetical protein
MVTKLAAASVLACLAGLVALRGAVGAEPALFESRQLTPSGEYTGGIEGPAVDAAGTLYVVNLGRQGTIGKLRPGAARSELFTSLPGGSIGNGIRFDRRRRSIFIPIVSTSQTIWRSRATAHCLPAIRAFRTPARFGALYGGATERVAAR